ncbi:MAG: CHASE2 domain-containing protein [Rivularia sp. (in: Bacteria)]|nr:CHASE2 domain-containing protein [Rivularia sp. MS3]
MQQRLWNRIRTEFLWKFVSTIPGIAAIIIIVFARVTGSLQFLEWTAFDRFMRLRPEETVDRRILIVGINEDDIRKIKKYPIPDKEIALLLRELQTYQPAAIGLDIYRDLPVEPGHTELISTFKDVKNLIAIEQILPGIGGKTVNQPPTLPQSKVGFADAKIDEDGKLRRSLLAASDSQDNWRFSLSLKLAEKYLESKGISLGNVEGDDYGLRFGSTELVRFKPNFGSYINADVGGTQMLINFRSHPQPFEIVSLQDVLDKKVEPDLIRNRIVLIGMTSPSVKDYFTSEAIKSQHSAFIYGVEIQAHIVSQIISAVEDDRVLFKTWWEGWEYIWIISWGCIGIVLARNIRSPLKLLLLVIVISSFLICFSYQLLIIGWWIPVVPPLLILIINGLVLATFYQYEKNLRLQIANRQLVIDQTFDTIHSGPLQTLAMTLRKIEEEEELSREKLLLKLRNLNQELRGVYTSLKREAMTDGRSFHITPAQELDLQEPINEILYEIYFDVLERDFPCFKTIEFKIVDFQLLNEQNLNSEQKRGICTFLEEALSNVGKYAANATKLEVICKQHQGCNLIRVVDNGLGIASTPNPSRKGFGTKQAQNIARQLRGQFKRFANSPQGTVCELIWSGKKQPWWRF